MLIIMILKIATSLREDIFEYFVLKRSSNSIKNKSLTNEYIFEYI
jgi:hypothetical protein